MSRILDEYLKQRPDFPMIFDHQKDAIEWIYNQWLLGQPCLIADVMGLGKTAELCVALQLMRVSKALVIVPTSVVYQMVRALLKFAPDYYVYINTDHTIKQMMLSPDGTLIESAPGPVETLNYVVNHPTVTVCTYFAVKPFPGVVSGEDTQKSGDYEMSFRLDEHRRELTPFNNIIWDVVACDEIHKIRNGVNTKLDSTSGKKMLMYHRLMRLQMNPQHSIKIGLSGTIILIKIIS